MTALDLGCPSGCGRPVQFGHLMCRACWSKVPRDLQQDVYRTWRVYRPLNAAPRDRGLDLMRAREAYRAARDAAIASVP